MFVGSTAVSVRIPGPERKSLIINKGLVFNGPGAELKSMAN